MEQRRRCQLAELSVEVVAEAIGEHEVHDEGAGRDGVAAHIAQQRRRQHQARCDERHDEHEARRRQEPPRPTRPEVVEGDRPRRLQLPQEQLGDQEPRDHEEHVDADEASFEPGHLGVEQHDRHHGDRAQALDITAELTSGHPVERTPDVAAPPIGGGSTGECARCHVSQ